jgi:hypothetical protein
MDLDSILYLFRGSSALRYYIYLRYGLYDREFVMLAYISPNYVSKILLLALEHVSEHITVHSMTCVGSSLPGRSPCCGRTQQTLPRLLCEE